MSNLYWEFMCDFRVELFLFFSFLSPVFYFAVDRLMGQGATY